MPQTDAPGPLMHFDIGGAQRPFYIVVFDEDGECKSPQTQGHLLGRLAAGHSDILLFSHGWNNDWDDAKGAYKRFITEFHHFAIARNGALPPGYMPLFVGVFWRSISLVLPWEEAPELASPASIEAEAVAELLSPARKTDFCRLISHTDQLSLAEARELASIFAEILTSRDDISLSPEAVAADELLQTWRAASPPEGAGSASGGDGLSRSEIGTVDRAPSAGGPRAQTAGFFDFLDPRWLVRLATVRIMKDRAGVVGGNGVAELLGALAAGCNARIHGIGHSYGTNTKSR